MEPKICPRCKGNGFFKVKESVEVHDKEFDEYFDTHPLLKPLQRKHNGSN